MTTSSPAVPRPASWRKRELKKYLHACKGRGVHIIDPFKVPESEVIEKAVLAEQAGGAWLILASTDCPDFPERMSRLVPEVARAVSIPVVLHFPPARGRGLPVVAGATGYLWPALLESTDPYFVWESFLETVARWSDELPASMWPEPILCAALTIGSDSRTADLLGTVGLREEPEALERTARMISLMGLDMVYLYSRNERVEPRTCEYLREHLTEDQLVFVSGNVRTPEDIGRYLDAGADFVGFAGACEGPDWRSRLAGMLAVRR